MVGPIVGSGAPTDAVTGAAVAGKGSFYIDYAAGAWYYNSGTKASPVWSAFGSTAGAATPTSVVSSGRIVSTSPTAGVGYATGAGGAVTQATDKSTAVTLNTATGAITMNNASLADATNVTFTVTDSAVAATDTVIVNHKSGGTLGSLHSVEWALLAVMVALWHRWSRPPACAEDHGRAPVFTLMVLASLIMAGLSVAQFKGRWTLDRGLEADLAQARANVGRIYFPWNPMLTIITERRVYPLDDALYGLATAGLEPPPEIIRATVPPGALLIYHEDPQSHFAAPPIERPSRPGRPSPPRAPEAEW